MKPAIWRWFDGKYKAHCPTKELRDQMLRWSGVVEGGVYTMPDGPNEYDVIIPTSCLDRAKKLLGVRVLTE